ncbi:MAG: sigma 54-interacting transcriptional regulator [Myxococcales bacterium]|nr:sigma 54-interacting transcriptional regulator [Myxococcales bacterium]
MAELSRPRVLVIDDGELHARIVAERFGELELIRPGGKAQIGDGPSALSYLRRHAKRVDLVLLDVSFDLPEAQLLELPEARSLRRRKRFQGVAILREIRRRHPRLPVVLLTAREDLDWLDGEAEAPAQESMTYYVDGNDLPALRVRIQGALQAAALGAEEGEVLWGGDGALLDMRRRLSVLARGRMPLILEGETGTGKSFLAERFVHRLSGRAGPFVVVDLSTVPQELVPAHLFGATRGAYTGAVSDRKGVFEAAHGGTLFIDEIQSVPPEIQKQLLLVLQDGRLRPLGGTREVAVDVKVVAASSQDLEQAVAQGRFRADLYMRLSPATRTRIPPLRERPADLEFFARRFARRSGEDSDIAPLCRQILKAAGQNPSPNQSPALELHIGRPRAAGGDGVELWMPESAWSTLKQHPWPGNLRELSMLVHNLVAFTLVEAADALEAGAALEGPRLQIDAALVSRLLPATTARLPSQAPEAVSGAGRIGIEITPQGTLNEVSRAVERQYLGALFRSCEGDLSRMALQLLGDGGRARAVRLRINQLGVKLKDLRRP